MAHSFERNKDLLCSKFGVEKLPIMKKNDDVKPHGFDKISTAVTHATGSTAAFITAFSIILLWIITGPIFSYSDTWQLVINTGTTIITFLMVFLIQRSQNKDSMAVHLKLNELIIANEHASNRLLTIEEISEDDLKVLKLFYKKVADLENQSLDLEETHSIDKAHSNHKKKLSAKSTSKKE